MINDYKKIIHIIRKVRIKLRLSDLFKGSCLTCFIFICLIIIESLLDYFISFTSIQRLWILYSIVGQIIICSIWFIIRPLFTRNSDDDTALVIQKSCPALSDDLVNALQLGKLKKDENPWVSHDLIDTLVKNTAINASKINPLDVVKFPLKKYLVPNLAVFFLFIMLAIVPPRIMRTTLPRLFNPMDYGRISSLMKVLPGDIEIMSGKNLKVEVIIQERRGKAFISYRETGGAWNSMRMNALKEQEEGKRQRKYIHEFENLSSDMEYFVKWSNAQSPVYSVKVITLPEIGDISLVYHYPSYAGISERIVENTNGDIEALYGTKVKISARANKSIKKGFLVTNDGKRFPVKIRKGIELESSLLLTGEEEYSLTVEDSLGYMNEDPVRHRITILKDEEPGVKMIAPDMDLVVSQESVIDIACEVKDDFGVKKVELVYQKSELSDFEPERLTIKRFKPAVEMKIVNYEWDMGKLSLRPGDILSYYIEVSDNDLISGPNKGVSRTFYIEVFSYEKEHREIEEGLADFRDRLMNLLGDQIMAKDALEKAKTADSLEKLKDSKERQKGVREGAGDLVDLIEKLFPRMENDPLVDWRTYTEYKNITGHIRLLESGKMKQAVNEITGAEQARDAQSRSSRAGGAIKTQQEIIDELEKMALLSEDILQNQKMNDLMDVAHEMVDKQTDFTRALEELAGKADKEKLEQLSKTLSEISNLMNELQKALKDMPQELPEEFVNQDSIKDMDVGEMGNLMEELQKDMAAGNIDSALARTQQLLDMLSEMMDTLMEAASNVPSSELDSLSKETDEFMKELDGIIEEQEKIIEETAGYDEKMMEELMKQQEKILKELSELQKEVISRTKKLIGGVKGKLEYPRLRSKFSSRTRDSLKDMQKAFEDMVNPPARKAKDFIKNVLVKLDASRTILSIIENRLTSEKEAELEILLKNKKPKRKEREKKRREILKAFGEKKNRMKDVSDEFNWIYDTEKKILEKLEKSNNSGCNFLSKDDMEKLRELSDKQNGLRQRTDSLNQGLRKLSMKTSAIGPDILGNMKNGSSEMNKAGNALSEGDTPQAMESEQSALQHLTQGKEGLQAAGSQMKGMMKQMGMGMQYGQGMPGFMQPRGGSLPGGRMGFRDRKVRIPTAEDYQVPREFRQDIMDAMKEKYPEIYKDLIKKYYKRLTE